MMMGLIGPSISVVAPSTTTFDPSNKGTSQTLSGGNLTATGNGSNGVVRSLASHSTGKFYCEFTVNNNASFNTGIGLIDASGDLNTFWYGNAHQFGFTLGFNGWNVPSGGTGGGVTTTPTFSATNVGALCFDIGGKLAWVKNLTTASNWNADASGNPATGAGGFDWSGISVAGNPAFAMLSCCGNGENTTFNFGATAYTGTPPSGFGNW